MFVFCFLFVHTVPKRAPHFDRGGCEKTQPPRSECDSPFVSENVFVFIYHFFCIDELKKKQNKHMYHHQHHHHRHHHLLHHPLPQLWSITRVRSAGCFGPLHNCPHGSLGVPCPLPLVPAPGTMPRSLGGPWVPAPPGSLYDIIIIIITIGPWASLVPCPWPAPPGTLGSRSLGSPWVLAPSGPCMISSSGSSGPHQHHRHHHQYDHHIP